MSYQKYLWFNPQQEGGWAKAREQLFLRRWFHFLRTDSKRILWWRKSFLHFCAGPYDIWEALGMSTPFCWPAVSFGATCLHLWRKLYRPVSVGHSKAQLLHWVSRISDVASEKLLWNGFGSISSPSCSKCFSTLYRYLWKSEKPLYHSSIDRAVVYKRRGELHFLLTPCSCTVVEKLNILTSWNVSA